MGWSEEAGEPLHSSLLSEMGITGEGSYFRAGLSWGPSRCSNTLHAPFSKASPRRPFLRLAHCSANMRVTCLKAILGFEVGWVACISVGHEC